ncbi:hypothetical protein A6046_03455 [[Haemophilus] ducreyi]|uniref:Uncharacterized protein n=1 Tax=Haemophilus ducreyi TaxID=730 RepID=A0AAC8ZA87_HAEDC|nr:hypothetical protein [[Haemophilus] ducreyi]AKO30318.1 hypothetical protein RY60_00605 [[Haemophilus] ducreyi]AKO31751.1 hypothetical protein RZ57_00610 [[Haemophilus] ducreyi]AKO33205.1 hypothetical protein RZ58_00615 [[Haemophilus] ducreyi]AKO34653.1 hypothetical protein RZ59_00605 [[Haemophilus] ducreyi]AKO43712.1 hypothetical protein RZ60_02085 [[Haemophilus] ducreyi]
MFEVFNKIISSSLSMAFLGVLSWSAAYSYGWAQSYYYGFPWWYVEVGASNVARSLVYVLYVTFIIFVTYLIGVFLLIKTKPFLSLSCIRLVRAAIIFLVGLLPILIISTLLIGKISQKALLIYLGLVFVLTCLFHNAINRHLSSINLREIMHFFQDHKSYVLLSTYLYFVFFAFVIGYLKPCFKSQFDMLEVNDKMYYVLAKYHKTFILSKELVDNGNFYLYELNPNELGHIQIVSINKSF